MHLCQVGRERRRALRGSIHVFQGFDTHVTLLISVMSWSMILSPPLLLSFSIVLRSFFTSWNLVSQRIILCAKFGDTTPPGNLHTPWDEVKFCEKKVKKSFLTRIPVAAYLETFFLISAVNMTLGEKVSCWSLSVVVATILYCKVVLYCKIIFKQNFGQLHLHIHKW